MGTPTVEQIQKVLAKADLLYDKDAVDSALKKMALAITEKLADKNPIVVCVLNGGVVPFGIMLPNLDFPLQVDYLHATRYRGKLKGADIEWIAPPKLNPAGRAILLIDDILDEGTTLAVIEEYYKEKNAVSIYKAVLIEKNRPRDIKINVDFLGLTVPNRYVFGYGMDYKSYLRNAPGIYALKDEM